MYNKNLIAIFAETRDKALTDYIDLTKQMIRTVKVYKTTKPLKVAAKKPMGDMNIIFNSIGTVANGYGLKENTNKKVAILNFADALVPGGCVEYGSRAQEECICRCTNLYEGLILDRCVKDYYEYNHRFKHIYSNRIIYSKNVLVFRDDHSYEFIKPRELDVITCPAPSCTMSKELALATFTSRAEDIIKVAIANGVTDIVLGAWGCGAFGQDPTIVGKAFAVVLNKFPYFNSVTFGIVGDDNYEPFFLSFRDNYERSENINEV